MEKDLLDVNCQVNHPVRSLTKGVGWKLGYEIGLRERANTY